MDIPYSQRGVLTRYLRYWLSTSSSTGRWRGPSRLPRTVRLILTQMSLFPLARTPSRTLHSKASLQRQRTAVSGHGQSQQSQWNIFNPDTLLCQGLIQGAEGAQGGKCPPPPPRISQTYWRGISTAMMSHSHNTIVTHIWKSCAVQHTRV